MRFRREGTNWEGRRWSLVGALDDLATEIESLWPDPHPTDGTVASKAHDDPVTGNPDSDHRPYPYTGPGVVHALDAGEVTEDDGFALAEALRRSEDPRLSYVIHEGAMFSSYPAHGFAPWTWRPYGGPSMHGSWVHISTRRGVSGGPWNLTNYLPNGGEIDMVKAKKVEATKATEGVDPARRLAYDWLRSEGVYTEHTNPDEVPPNDLLAEWVYRYHHRVVMPLVAEALRSAGTGAADNVARQLARRALDGLRAIGEAAGDA